LPEAILFDVGPITAKGTAPRLAVA